MRCLGLPSILARTLHRSRSLEQVEVPMLQIRVNAAAIQRSHLTCTLALMLGLAGIASADSIEVAGIAPANSVEVVGIAPATSVDSAEVAAVILSDDAMPLGPSVAERLAIIRQKIQNALE